MPTVETFSFGGVVPVCSNDVPFIEITFSQLTQLNGLTGTLSFFDINDNFIEQRPLTYQSGTTVRFIYPGAVMDANGNAVDWPGWVRNSDGFWVPDPTDAIWRDGLNLVAEINPTATAFVTYPPATAACASPQQTPGATTTSTVPGGSTPTPPGSTPTQPVSNPPRPRGTLPVTGGDIIPLAVIGATSLFVGAWLRRREQRQT